MTDPRPTVVLVDDHELLRAGVRAELEGHAIVVGEASGPTDAIEVIAATAPDVVLLDVHMPGGGGVEVLRRLAERGIDTHCLALSVSDDPQDVIAIIRAGARGYVTKSIRADELADAIERVRGGDAVFSPRLAGFVLDAFTGSAPPQAPPTGAGDDADADADEALESLTPREREVLRHIARGYLYKEVAQRLGISVKTVEAHVSAVLRKLQLSTRHELSRWASERDLD